MIDIRDARQSDLDFVRQNPLEEALKVYPELEIKGYAKTGIVNGEIVGVGGVIVYYAGRGEAWMVLSKKVNDFKVETVLCLHKMMEQAISELKLKRLECSVRADFPKAKELIECLGFKCETPKPMKCYCPDGADAYLYSIVRNL